MVILFGSGDGLCRSVTLILTRENLLVKECSSVLRSGLAWMVGEGGMKRHELVHIWPEAGALNRELESFYGGKFCSFTSVDKTESFIFERQILT